MKRVIRVGSLLSGGPRNMKRAVVVGVSLERVEGVTTAFATLASPDGGSGFLHMVDGHFDYLTDDEPRWTLHRKRATKHQIDQAIFQIRMEEAEFLLPLEYPHLVPLKRSESARKDIVVENLKRELKKNFPEVTFEGRFDGSAIVRWAYGPKEKNVEAVMDKFTGAPGGIPFFNHVFGQLGMVIAARMVRRDIDRIEKARKAEGPGGYQSSSAWVLF